MSDYEQIVVGIQTILASEAAVSPEALEEFEQPYIDAVVDVNERLRECNNLLAKGLRSEAIQLGDGDPDLLDAVRTLDFPERDVWAEFVRQFRLPAPPQLLIDIAAELNEAYDLEKPLARLMRSHRLHALAGSSLRPRIDVMRKIAAADSRNPLWEADIRTFENARLEQLPGELAAAKAAKNLKAITTLEKEVRSEQWLEPPSEALVKKAVRAHTKLRQEKARLELAKIEESLNAAFADFDVVQGRRCRAQWSSRLALAGLAADDPLLERAAPALEWIAQQDQQEQNQTDYDAAIADLELALDENAPREELERLYHAAARFEWGVPDPLERRLAERLCYLEVASTRRNRMVIVSVVAFVIMAAGAAAAGVYYQTRSSTTAKHVAAFENLIAKEEFAGANRYASDLKESDQGAYQSPEFQAAFSELKTLQTAEDARKQRFDSALAQVKQWLDEGTQSSVQDGILLLNQTKKEIARGANELHEISLLETRLESERVAIRDAEESDIRESLVDLGKHAKATDPDNTQALAQLLREGKQLQGRSRSHPRLRDPAQGAINMIEGLIERQQERLKIKTSLEKITKNVGSQSGYLKAMEAFEKEFPDTPSANVFKQTRTGEAKLWEGYDRWLAFIGELQQKKLMEQTPDQAELLVRRAVDLEDQFGRFPLNKTVDEVVGYLKTITQRSGGGGAGIVGEVRQLLEFPGIKELFIVYYGTKEGGVKKKYYTKQKPGFRKNGDLVVFEAVTNTDFDKFKDFELLTATILNPKDGNSRDWRSPQQYFRQWTLGYLDDLESKDVTWENTFAKTLRLLNNAQGGKNPVVKMDPLLKIQLAAVLIESGCRGSDVLAQAYGKDLAELQKGRFSTESIWVYPGDKDGPDNEEGRAASEEAQGILDKLDISKRPTEVITEIKRGLAALESPDFGPQYQWVGWLSRPTKDQWSCPVSEAPQNGVTAYVLFKDGLIAQFTPIGTFSNGQLNFKADANSALREGRIVYIEQTL